MAAVTGHHTLSGLKPQKWFSHSSWGQRSGTSVGVLSPSEALGEGLPASPGPWRLGSWQHLSSPCPACAPCPCDFLPRVSVSTPPSDGQRAAEAIARQLEVLNPITLTKTLFLDKPASTLPAGHAFCVCGGAVFTGHTYPRGKSAHAVCVLQASGVFIVIFPTFFLEGRCLCGGRDGAWGSGTSGP